MLTFVGLLLSVTATTAAPLASVHVKFVSPPHVYEHGLTTDGGATISQQSYLSIGRRIPRQFGQKIGRVVTTKNAEALWPLGLFVGPIDVNDLGFSSGDSHARHVTPDFSNGLEIPDPLLLRGAAAMRAINFLYGRGELFYDDFPHVRAVLRNQEERRRNGLGGNILGSLRPVSPFYRKTMF
ncbi:uncharacterized protein [Venturia canescens]|uniref:uncharacterized protein n=1 Tax=Venturia canescens TaxID=32260 RepID=UPI001C9D1005|nr:uncharacterized protein LOC122417636 [Venturia canescens]